MKSKDNLSTFEECKLGREQYAKVLTSIVATYRDGFVLAVNGKWGTGKTTFMRMWENSLIAQGYKTIFFNAWENDFTSEPLIALFGEIRKLTTPENEKIFDNILEKVAKFATSSIPILAKTAASLGGVGVFSEIIEKISQVTVEAVNDEIKDYDDKKNSLQEIRAQLTEFIKDTCEDKPLVFIVDELDRCRPDYAVEVLEKIKHLFAVDGIVFVLSIDKEQLCHAVKGYYGSDGIDSSEYLRRFIDLEYDLPQFTYEEFIRYQYAVNEFNFVDLDPWYNKIDKGDTFCEVANIYCLKYKLTLRQIEKIFKRISVVSKIVGHNSGFDLHTFFILLIYKEYNELLYREIISTDISISIYIQKIQEEIASHSLDKSTHLYLLFCFIFLCEYDDYIKFLNDIKSVLNSYDFSNEEVETHIRSIVENRSMDRRLWPMNEYVKRIDLFVDLKV